MIIFLCWVFFVVLCARSKKGQSKGKKNEYFCSVCGHYNPGQNPLSTALYSRKKEIQYSFISDSHFVVVPSEKRVVGAKSSTVYHVPPHVTVVNPYEEGIEGFVKGSGKKETLYVGQCCLKDLIEDSLRYEEKLSKKRTVESTDLEKGEDGNRRICGTVSMFKRAFVQFSQGFQSSNSDEKKQMFWNNYLSENIYDDFFIGTVGRCPYFEYTTEQVDADDVPYGELPKCDWIRFYLDEVEEESGSKTKCRADTKFFFNRRTEGLTIDQVLRLDEKDGITGYKKSKAKEIWKSSSCYLWVKAKEFSDKYISYEKLIFSGPDQVAMDVGWPSTQSDTSHSCTYSMILGKDNKRVCYWKFEESESDWMKESVSFPKFADRLVHHYACERFPDAKSYVFDGCYDNVHCFYKHDLPYFQKKRENSYQKDVTCVVTTNDFYGIDYRVFYWWENKVTKYNKLKKLGSTFSKTLCITKHGYDWFFKKPGTIYEVGGFVEGGSFKKANYQNTNKKTAILFKFVEFGIRKDIRNYFLRQGDFSHPNVQLSSYTICESADTDEQRGEKSLLIVPQIGGTFDHGFLEFPGKGYAISKCRKKFDYSKLEDYTVFIVDVSEIDDNVDPYECTKNTHWKRRLSSTNN